MAQVMPLYCKQCSHRWELRTDANPLMRCPACGSNSVGPAGPAREATPGEHEGYDAVVADRVKGYVGTHAIFDNKTSVALLSWMLTARSIYPVEFREALDAMLATDQGGSK